VSVPDHAWSEHGAPGSGMHVDFVLADASTLEPRLAIELDDRSHGRPEAKERDAFKDAVLAAAGMPLLRVVTGRFSVAALRARIREMIGMVARLSQCRAQEGF
jgi:very-short-patch-repair endonuclease